MFTLFFLLMETGRLVHDTVCLEGAEPGRPHETFRNSPGTGIEISIYLISIHMFGMAFQLQSSISYRKCAVIDRKWVQTLVVFS